MAKAVAWSLLPLLVLSSLTGLFIAYGVTFASTSAANQVSALPLRDAVRVVQDAGHDLSGLVWLRFQEGQTLARLSENGEWRLYAVTPDGAAPQPRDWPRLLHEGNFVGVWPPLLNVVTSLALILLLATGLALWVRRTFLRRRATGGQVSRLPGTPSIAGTTPNAKG